jgi:hypothetical protein
MRGKNKGKERRKTGIIFKKIRNKNKMIIIKSLDNCHVTINLQIEPLRLSISGQVGPVTHHVTCISHYLKNR